MDLQVFDDNGLDDEADDRQDESNDDPAVDHPEDGHLDLDGVADIPVDQLGPVMHATAHSRRRGSMKRTIDTSGRAHDQRGRIDLNDQDEEGPGRSKRARTEGLPSSTSHTESSIPSNPGTANSAAASLQGLVGGGGGRDGDDQGMSANRRAGAGAGAASTSLGITSTGIPPHHKRKTEKRFVSFWAFDLRTSANGDGTD